MRTLEENLSYSAKRMTEVWSKRYPTIASAKPYANNPAMLAEKVYGGRLGNNKPGDGWAFRGSGILQTTGRDNFEEIENDTGVPVVSQPDLLRTFPGALKAATIFWKNRNINARADRNDATGVCKAVNGGTTGLADQRAWLAKTEKIWPDSAAPRFSTKRATTPPPQSQPK
ncbi:glycoside hydrolase family 19 protein [Mesorhizobium caraganae]|uniref:glycoside hydrolase family 19 protein n=1 Tax=Mesorhizobium caraganae TaxID=483206 RepID=UPI003ECCA647